MKKIFALALLTFSAIPNTSFALEISGTKSARYVLVANLGLECQVVLHKQADEKNPAVLKELQKRNLKVEKASYADDDGGKSITFWIQDEHVRNLNCLIH